jgi:pyruvate kinase
MLSPTALRARRLIAPLQELYEQACELEISHAADIAAIDAAFDASARNLLHYLAMRQNDIRPLQTELAALGLSSLGRLEAHTLTTLQSVLIALHRLSEQPEPHFQEHPPVTFFTGPMLLNQHSLQLLGEPAGKRIVRIMVTMPSEAATDRGLLRSLLAAGMDVMRINCAHDEPADWLAMIRNLRQAERELGRPCKVYADLAGPKLRTGAIAPTSHLVKFRPARDAMGKVTEPAHLWLVADNSDGNPSEEQPAPQCPNLVRTPVDPALLAQIAVGDELRFVDRRGRKRRVRITEATAGSYLGQAKRTGYLEQGAAVALYRGEELIAEGCWGTLPPLVLPLQLTVGDHLRLVNEEYLGHPARYDEAGQLVAAAQSPITLAEVFAAVQLGEPIWFDDGKIGGQVAANDGKEIDVIITHTPPNGSRLQAEKGVNLPLTKLAVPALTDKDLQDLAFLVDHVDMVGLSFVHTPADIALLHQTLDALGATNVGIVLKIETQQAFENLPRILLTSLRKPPVGVMVARGDLAVEVGFERLAEVQEEILWLCEAAHVPVIWATQVLESMAKRGMPSRAEVSDAVMSGRAECVMLNKGPYSTAAVRLLNGVLERMSTHQAKKRSMLRKLSVSQV